MSAAVPTHDDSNLPTGVPPTLTEDARIEAFFARIYATFWSRAFAYTNNQGKDYLETARVACTHLFNRRTHHRGQVHVMLRQTSVGPPSLDFHRIVNP